MSLWHFLLLSVAVTLSLANEPSSTVLTVVRQTNSDRMVKRGDTQTDDDEYNEDEYAEEEHTTKKIKIRGRDGSSNDNEHNDLVYMFDPDYYDWGFGHRIAPGVPPRDAKGERPVTTDISCWDCDEEEAESCLLVRCDYTLVFNSSKAPKGFACMRYQIVAGSKTYTKSKCAYAPSPFFDPCEEELRFNRPNTKMQNCLICWDDACNNIQKSSINVVLLLIFLAVGVLFCLLAVCITARNKYFRQICKVPTEPCCSNSSVMQM